MTRKEKKMNGDGKKDVALFDIIRYPLVTEKSTNLSAHNQVTFAVLKTASKPEIKAAVEAAFGVSVKAVNTLIRKGKTRRFKGRAGVQEDVKKAIITLNDGQRLDLGSGI